MPEKYTHRSLEILNENCEKVLDRILMSNNRKEKKKKKPRVAQQAWNTVKTMTHSAGKQLSVFRQNSRPEEHQKLL